MDAAGRIEAASSFILQSPPGEINDVLNDIRNIISDDTSLQDGVLPALQEYNVEQFTAVDVPGTKHQCIVSEAGRLPSSEGEEERFIDPRSKTSFRFDHLSLEASDQKPIEPDTKSETLRVSLEASTLAYLSAHFHDGVASVFSVPDHPKRFVVQVVANKYNPANYWSGRWRSSWTIDIEEHKLDGKIFVNVHYYEQGNVQLTTTHTASIILPSPIISAAATSPSTCTTKILALLADEEGHFQTGLNDAYTEMGEKTFKGLRRALPLTRQKMEWDRVLGYKLGAELTAGKGGFGGGDVSDS